jgi:hypothetical protein
MPIEKLQKLVYDIADPGYYEDDNANLLVKEVVVQYTTARSREDALLTALKECMYEIRDRSSVKKSALEIIHQIEESR